MHRTPFGSTGLSVPPIVFGSTSLGNLYTAIPAEDQRKIVAEWFHHVDGVVFIDTAGKYGAGLALENLATRLQELQISPQRVVISNKLGWIRVPLVGAEPTFEPDVWVDLKHDAVQDIGYDGILRCHRQGNKLLGDYCSKLASVHDPDEYLAAANDAQDREARWQHILDAYRALGELKANGEIAAIGVGAKDWTVIRDLYEVQPLDWIMIANSFTLHSHPPALVQFLDQLERDRIPVINSAVFNGGFLVGGEFYNYRLASPNTDEGKRLLAWRAEFESTCQTFQVDPSEACIAFGNSHPAIKAMALSSSKPTRVAKNIQALSAALPHEFWAALRTKGLVTLNADTPKP